MIFDFHRPDEDPEGCNRIVLDATSATFRVDQTDEWIDVPLRTVLVDGLGFRFEIGPYSIEGEDARRLINALDEYGRRSGDFRHVTAPSTAPERDNLATVYPIPVEEPSVDDVDTAEDD